MVLADSAVESANIVGYTDVTMDQKYTILGVNFTAVDGTALTLQDAVPYVDGMTAANVNSAADQIQIQNAAGTYDIYYMSNGYNGKNQIVSGLEHKWAAAGKYVVATASIPAGKGAWFVRKGSTDFEITISRPYTIE